MIYLNNAATTFPKPKEVIEAVTDHLNSFPCHGSRAGFDRELEDADYACRAALARLFNISDPFRVIFTSGSTEALNLAIKGIDIRGGHVVTTLIEHNSVIRPLKTLEREGEIELTFVGCDANGYVAPDDIEKAIKPNTKAIILNHSSNVTGSIIDIQKISEIAHKHGLLFVVDASQSAGTLPIDFEGWDIDALAFTGHKSLYGLPGIGGLCLKEGLNLKALKTGGTGVLSEVLYQPDNLPLRYEAGTPNMPGIVSLKAGVDFVTKTGMDKIHDRKRSIVKRFISELSKHPKFIIHTHEANNSLCNFCFNIRNMVPEEVGYFLESSYDISVRTGLHCAPLILEPMGVHPWGTVRVSPSYFTTDEEATKFLDSVIEVASYAKA